MSEEKVIELLEAYRELSSEYVKTEKIDKAIELLKSKPTKPESGEFKRPDLIHPVDGSDLLEVVYLKRSMTPEEFIILACDLIDRLEAENKEFKKLIGVKTELIVDEARAKKQRALEMQELRAELSKAEAELKAKDEVIKEALGMAKEYWASVGNHSSSRHKKDVEYFEQALKEKNI